MNEKNNDLSDFMLKEYEHLAEAYFNSHEITAKWIKYYLIIMATPFSLIAFIYKDKPDQFKIFALSDTLAIFIGLVGTLGLLIAPIIVNVRLDTTLYARAVNGVRKYFWDIELERNKILNKREGQYRVLPDTVKKPKFLKLSDLVWLTLLMGVINAFYLTVGISQISICHDLAPAFSQGHKTIFFVVASLHIVYYVIVAIVKENKYPDTVQDQNRIETPIDEKK